MSQTTDPTLYRSPREAVAAPPEQLAYVAAYDPAGRAHDSMAVLDCAPASPDYGRVVGWSELPTGGNELHHFGWNACSSALCHPGRGDHGQPLERRYGIFLSAMGGANGHDGPGGVALVDHDSFEVIGPWEQDRGDQYLAYDLWWHLDYDTMVTSEWATPSMFEHGLDPQDLLGRRFGHHLNFWSMSQRTLTQRVDLGDAHQMVLALRPAHDPEKAWGFVGVVISVEDLSGSVWLWHRDGERWAATKAITIPATPADPERLPPALQPFGAVPP